jgi:hypothetical protein
LRRMTRVFFVGAPIGTSFAYAVTLTHGLQTIHGLPS